MKLQKHLSKKGEKKYHKYVVVLPNKAVKKAGFRKGTNLEVEAIEGEIKLVKEGDTKEVGKEEEEEKQKSKKKTKKEQGRKNYIC